MLTRVLHTYGECAGAAAFAVLALDDGRYAVGSLTVGDDAAGLPTYPTYEAAWAAYRAALAWEAFTDRCGGGPY